MRNFLDKTEVEARYPQELVAAVGQWTGAQRVAPMSWMVRTSGDLDAHRHEQAGYQHKGGVQPPAAEAHCDSSPDRVDAMAAALYQQRFPGAPPYRRFLYTSFWRAFSPPPQDYPLALCEGRTTAGASGRGACRIPRSRI